MATVIHGIRSWSGDREDDGHRTYKITYLVKGSTSDGPATVMQTIGLPTPGDQWIIGNDVDVWAWCLPRTNISIHQEKEGDPNKWWKVDCFFSTKPLDSSEDRQSDGGNNTRIEDPLLEPPKISGSVSKYTEHGIVDMFGRPITNSAHEKIQGPINEWDRNRPSIKIEQNVATPSQAINLPLAMLDCVNAFPLWGLPARTVKLSGCNFDRKTYGNGNLYYTRHLDFDINFSSFDREVLDEGTKFLLGEWDKTTKAYILKDIDGAAPNPLNPTHFIAAKDIHGIPIRAILDGAGQPYNPDAAIVPTFFDNGSKKPFSRKIIGFAEGNNEVIDLWTGTPPAPNTSTADDFPPQNPTATLFKGGKLGAGAYSYVITGVNEDGETEISNEVSATPTATHKTIRLQWDIHAGTSKIVKYRIYRKNIFDGNDFFFIQEVIVRANAPGSIRILKYSAANFLLLGIPTSL